MGKKTFLKYDEGKNTDGDGRISNIEYRPEENEGVSAHKGQPLGKDTLQHREIEQIYDLPVQESGVSTAFGKQGGGLAEKTLTEDQAIKCTVDDIAQGPGHDQADGSNQARGGFLVDETGNIPADKHHGENAEYAEYQFAIFSGKLQTESHAVVFGKMDDKPVTKNVNALSQGHAGFDQNLGDLINQQD